MDQDPPTRASLQVCCARWNRGRRLTRESGRRIIAGTCPDGGSLTPPGRAPGLLAALLDVPADELLRVLLQYRVDLVQQVVDVLGDLLLPLGDLGVRLGRGALVELLVAAGLACLRLTASVAGSHALALLQRGGEKN